MRFLRVLNIGGVISCSLGSIFALFALAKGKHARQLQGATYVENLSELKHLFSLVPILIAVSGRVWASKPIKCELDDQVGVIVALREEKKSETRSQNIWLTDTEPLRETIREVPWALVDGMGPFAVHLPVVDGSHASGDCFQLSGDVFTPAADGLVDQVLGQLVGHKNLGLRQVERYLPTGAQVTAVGELAQAIDHPGAFKGAFREGGKMLVLRAPKKGPFVLSKKALPELIASAQATSSLCTSIATGLFTLGGGMLALSLYYTIMLRKREKEVQRRVQAARARQAAAATTGAAVPAGAGQQQDSEDPERRGLCVVCLESGCEMVFPSCGHLCVCSRCANGSGSLMGRCPICRSRGRPIKVFVA